MYFNYNVGDFVKIINWPFSGVEGKIISINDVSGLYQIETIFLVNLFQQKYNLLILKKYNFFL